jgi:hypothetical protein
MWPGPSISSIPNRATAFWARMDSRRAMVKATPSAWHFLMTSLSIWAAVKSISRMPVASRTINRVLDLADRKAFSMSWRKRYALRKDSGAANPATMMSGSITPRMCGLGGHQTEVPGTCSKTIMRARVVLQMPCKSESAMPIATPCSIGRTMIAAVVEPISRNSPNDCR